MRQFLYVPFCSVCNRVISVIVPSGARYENGYIEPKAPEIGMTADEVRNSTWGEPKEINKTTTKYGVREQWVYSSRRYIYLEDGIVVAIQE